MIALQTDGFGLERGLDALKRFARFDRQTELAVDLTGADEFMGVRVNTRLDAQQNIDGFAVFGGNVAERIQLLEIIDDHAADAGFHGVVQFVKRFVVAVEIQFFRRNAGGQRRINLTARHHVESQPFLGGNAAHFFAAKRLGRVIDQTVAVIVFLDGIDKGAAVFSDLLLVHDVARRAELSGKLQRIRAADGQAPFFVYGNAIGNKHLFFSAAAAASSCLFARSVNDSFQFLHARAVDGRAGNFRDIRISGQFRLLRFKPLAVLRLVQLVAFGQGDHERVAHLP